MDNPEEDLDLQRALALSLQEFNAPQQTQQTQDQTNTHERNKSSKEGGEKGAPNDPGKTSGPRTTTTTKQRRGRKLPSYSPSEPEIEACFKELVSSGRSHISITDIIEAGSKLGLDLDTQKAGAMVEYLSDSGLRAEGSSKGGIPFSEFQAIVERFRVE